MTKLTVTGQIKVTHLTTQKISKKWKSARRDANIARWL